MIIALQSLIYYYFRESLLRILDRLIQPCYKSLTFSQDTDDEEPEDEQVFSEYDEDKGVVFYPPVYAQRYAAVSDCLMDERWSGKLEKVVDLGFHDVSFIKYLKEVPGIKSIIGVDIESIPLRCSSDLIGGGNYGPKRDITIKIQLFQGNAADPDYRLIGADAIVAIEMIEHMLPHDLERLVHTIFGFIKPRIAIITTPNGDFNVLFKALERNGFRRLDHYFEWSREQFHDWCTNIVRRYPDFSVTCKGIGPGPAGTDHLGCCSQLALFVCEDYHKQQDLSLDSLALVSQVPSPDNFDELLNSCDSRDDLSEITNISSFTSLTEIQSSVTITLSPRCYNEYGQSDKVAQCNMDNDWAKSFMMNEDETGLSVVVPRRRLAYRVYDMEDVACRLNCTTMKVKKFSKSAQKLMAKNKIDSLVHTRDVVTQIKQLTRLLNLKDKRRQSDEEHTWNNINWGDNAPYWNQYYKLIREYDYPNQEKPQDCIILELVSDEIHQLIDMQLDEEAPGDARLEIPLEYLMKAVEHITSDVDKVRELLEWNGYEVADGSVTYSRQLPDDASDCSSNDCWRDENFSEGDSTDVQSLSHSDGSKVLANYHARLRRALEQKVRRLRSTALEEDITSELECVVCRLMKLALKSSRGRDQPPPASWLQGKLYDLLSLAERAVEMRRMHFLRSYQICDVNEDIKSVDTVSILNKFKEDTTAQQIMDKYQHLVEAPAGNEMENGENYDEIHLRLDNTSVSSDGYAKAFQFQNFSKSQPMETITPEKDEDQQLARTKAWVDDEVTPTPLGSSHSALLRVDNDAKKLKTKTKKAKKQNKNTSKMWKKSHSKLKCTNSFAYDNDGMKVMDFEFDDFGLEHDLKKLPYLQSNSKPIPDDMIELCQNSSKTVSMDKNIAFTDDSKQHERTETISATEESFVIDIIADDYQQKVALRRSVGTEPEIDESDIETLVAEVNDDNEPLWGKQISKDDDQSLFYYDINEPSTSKGIRHLRADVQCGPDTMESAQYPSPEVSNTGGATLGVGVKIGGSLNNMLTASKKSVDFGTCTHEFDTKVQSSKNVFLGIKIKDSDHILETAEVAKQIDEEETKFLKPVSSTLNMDDSLPELCSSFGNSPSPTLDTSPIASVAIETVHCSLSPIRYKKPRLSCGGVHIHSYKDKQVLEDVIYQGEWQRYRPKTKTQRKTPVTLVTKKSCSTLRRASVRSKEKITCKRPTQSCDSSPLKIPVLTVSERMVKVNNDIAKKAELGKKLRVADTKKVAKKKSSPTSNIPKACIVSKRVTPKSSLILRNDRKKTQKCPSRVPLIKKSNDKKTCAAKPIKITKACKAKPIKITNAVLLKKPVIIDAKAKLENLKKEFKSSSPNRNISYVVYRSEVTTTSNDKVSTSPVNVKIQERRVPSPDMNSSCSSRNSVATVKALNIHSSTTSPVRSSKITPETEASTSKQKKFTKKAKGVVDDKENTSMSSANSNLSTKEAMSPNKNKFTGKSKNVIVGSGKTILTKPLNNPEQKSSSKIPSVAKTEKIKRLMMISPEHTQPQRENTFVKEITKKIIEANIVLVTSTPKKQFKHNIQPVTSPDIIPVTNIAQDKEALRNDIQRILEESLNFITAEEDTKPNILTKDDVSSKKSAAILQIKENSEVEESLDLKPAADDITTEPLAKDVLNPEKSAPCSAKKQNSGHPLNRTFDNTLGQESIVSLADTVLTLTDTDFMSFRSVTSVSKISEYFLADTALDDPANVSSVKDIFERKEQLQIQIPLNVNATAMQAFSGLSLGAELLVGDRPDRVNLQHSETGSFAAPVDRMITSEELFISGRSSSSFESCWVDEADSVVPDWLFQAMNQQPIAEEDPVSIPLPIEMPPPNDESNYDENGNEEPLLGADAGAGDGCGMHSDYSEDSSGSSTLSSSEDTSEAPSETILVDPAAVAAHYESFRDAMSSSTLRNDSLLDETTGELREANANPPRRRPQRPANSGFEADESSLDDPDVPLPPASPPL